LETAPSFTRSQDSIFQGYLLAVKNSDYSQHMALNKMLLFYPSTLGVNRQGTVSYLLPAYLKRTDIKCQTSFKGIFNLTYFVFLSTTHV